MSKGSDERCFKSVVEGEDFSRNFLVFGLPEEEEEGLETRISEVLEEVGLKPKLEAQQIGKKKPANVVRLVKVCVCCSLIVRQVQNCVFES